MTSDVSCQILEIPALGRNFKLGGLYDSRNDKIVPGFSPWDRIELEAPHLSVMNNNRTSYTLVTSDKLSEKLQKLEINGSLQLSILSGLVDPQGSASFLNKKQNTHHESSIYVRCHQGTLVKSLTMDHLGNGKITHLDVAISGANNSATHVVTQIQYGADATFTFRKRINQTADMRETSGKLAICGKNLIKVLGGALTGQGDSIALEGGKDVGIECQFEGDFKMPQDLVTPTNYEEAIEFARQFTGVVSRSIVKDTAAGNEPLGLPCLVTLYPLVKLPGAENAPLFKFEVSDILTSECVRLMENYEEVDEQLQDLLNDSLGSKIGPFRKKLEFFLLQFNSFRIQLKMKLRHMIVEIRSGQRDVAFLLQLIDRIRDEQFVFNPNRIDAWLREKHKELCTTRMFRDQLTAQLLDNNEDRLLIFPTENKINEHMSAPAVRFAVHFVLTSMASPESFLQLTKTTTLDFDDIAGNSLTVGNDQVWHREDEVVGHIEKEMLCYIQLVKDVKGTQTVFAMTALEVHDQTCTPGSSVFVYHKGILSEKNFKLLKSPRILFPAFRWY